MDVAEWLLEGDPAIRWQTMRDVLDRPAGEVDDERSRVAHTGWGSRLLALQDPGGQWGGGSYSPKWTSTTYTLLLLRDLGVDPSSPPVREAVSRVESGVVMGRERQPLLTYRGETCITGMCLALAAYFRPHRGATDGVVEWLLGEQLDDGGWNCQTVHGSTRSSFNTTILVLEGLLEYQQCIDGLDGDVATARQRGVEYLLERRLFRSLSRGEVVDPRWRLFSFPPRWHYDVLRGLEHLRASRIPPDDRAEEAVELVERKRRRDGTWPLQNHHAGKEHFAMEPGPGKPSRWNTLRALRVLRWFGRD
ncbi:MAG: hypothetical protein ACLFWM_07920 [Actinomycetota bacterium]